MTLARKIQLPLLICSGLLATSQAQAAPYYLTAELGQVQTSLDTDHFETFHDAIVADGGTAKLTQEDSDTAFSLGFGYQYTPQVAVEISYVNFGSLSATSKTTDTTGAGVTRYRTVTEKTEQQGLVLNAVGRYALNPQWSLKGTLGVAWLDQTAEGHAKGRSETATGTLVSTEEERSKKSSQTWVPVLGIGAGYQLNKTWLLELNWKRFEKSDPGLLGDQDLGLVSFGVNRTF